MALRPQFQNVNSIPDAFLRTMRSASEALEEMAAVSQESAKAASNETRERKKATQFFSRSSRIGTKPLEVVQQAAQRGLIASNTSTATFGQGFQNSIEGAFASATGVGLNQRNAIGQAGQDVESFFADAAFLGADPTDDELKQIRDFYQEGRENQARLRERVQGETIRRQNDAAVNDRAENPVVAELGKILAAVERWGYEAVNSRGSNPD